MVSLCVLGIDDDLADAGAGEVTDAAGDLTRLSRGLHDPQDDLKRVRIASGSRPARCAAARTCPISAASVSGSRSGNACWASHPSPSRPARRNAVAECPATYSGTDRSGAGRTSVSGGSS